MRRPPSQDYMGLAVKYSKTEKMFAYMDTSKITQLNCLSLHKRAIHQGQIRS